MNKKILAVVLVAAAITAAVAINAWAGSDDDDGRYRVVASQDKFVLFDVQSGRAWLLQPKANHKQNAWYPLKRLDNDADVKLFEATAGR